MDWLVLLFPDADRLVAAAELDWVALPAPASVPLPFPVPLPLLLLLLLLLLVVAPPPVVLPSSLGEKP